MRKIYLILALCSAALPLSACQTFHNADQAVALANQNVGNFTALDEKSWYYAEALYNVPAAAYLSAYRTGFLHDPLKSDLKGKLQTLNQLRGAVYRAYRAGNAAEFSSKIAELKQLSDQIRDLVPNR